MKQAKRHFYYQGSLIRMYHNIPLETREREREREKEEEAKVKIQEVHFDGNGFWRIIGRLK